MNEKIQRFNPTTYSYCYRLNQGNCYALKSGVCSLYLSEQEARNIEKQDSSVMKCRSIADLMFNMNYYQDPSYQYHKPSSIRIHPRKCGHYVFTDGQHRTCIAKHLNIKEMYVRYDIDERNTEILCNACKNKDDKNAENRKSQNQLMKLLRMVMKRKRDDIPSDFIDEEYMSFKRLGKY